MDAIHVEKGIVAECLSWMAAVAGGESDPLPSPFGLPELQNMDLPAMMPQVPASRVQQAVCNFPQRS